MTSGFSQAETITGDILLKYFSATCKSQGNFTKQALADAQAVISILNSIKDDEDCTSISGSISQLSNLELKLRQLSEVESHSVYVERLIAQENELFDQLSQVTDPFVILSLESAIRSVQLDRATFISNRSASDKYYGQDVKELYRRIISVSNTTFETIASNYRCINKNPGILPGITSLTGSIASVASSTNPAFGLQLSAVTDFVGDLLKGIRQGKYEKMIRKLADNSVALEGYKCVLESLTDRWCLIEDAEHYIDLKAKAYSQNQSSSKTSLQKVSQLIDRDIPVLMGWLNNVRAGVPASSVADAQRQENVFAREARLRASEAKAAGIISESRPIYESSASDEDRYIEIRSVVASLSGVNCGNGSGGSFPIGSSDPLLDIYSRSFGPYYLLGLEAIPVDTRGNNINFCLFDPFLQWPNGQYSPDLNLIVSQYSAWVSKARERVNKELTLVLLPDPLQIISLAYESSASPLKSSAYNALTQIIDFIDTNMPTGNEAVFTRVYEETKSSLSEIKKLMSDSIAGVISPQEALESIYDRARLDYGVVVLQSRVEMIMRVSVSHYLSQEGNQQSSEAMQLLVADSFIDSLADTQSGGSLVQVSTDIKRSRPIVIETLNTFGKVFGKNIADILKRNHKKIINTDDITLKDIYYTNISEICIMLSSMPVWPDDIRKEYCVNTQLPTIIPGGPSSVMLTKKHLDSQFSNRSCRYRNYIRKSKIYQEWGINLNQTKQK